MRLPAGRARTVLALLALRAGQVAASDRLIDAAWNGAPPASATTRLQGLISDLRRALPTEAGAVILTRGAGYLLDVTGDDIDLLQARRLMSLARSHRDRGEWRRRRGPWPRRMELWRGTPFDGLECAELQAEADAASSTGGRTGWRNSPSSNWNSAATRPGHPADPVDGALPAREGLVGCLIRALARSGRQAEAIAAYHELRRRLADELGVDPAPAAASSSTGRSSTATASC